MIITNVNRLIQLVSLPFLRQDHILVVTVITSLTLNVCLMNIGGDFIPELHPFQIVIVLVVYLLGEAEEVLLLDVLLLDNFSCASLSKRVIIIFIQLLL